MSTVSAIDTVRHGDFLVKYRDFDHFVCFVAETDTKYKKTESMSGRSNLSVWLAKHTRIEKKILDEL
jgi:hypothetical protein